MKTLELSAGDAVAIASLSALAGNDKATPILTYVHLVADRDAAISAVATDRFMLGRYATTGRGDAVDVLLSPAACKWITANVKRVNKHYSPGPVEVTYLEETREIALRHGGATYGETIPALMKFPAVESLLDNWAAGDQVTPIKLNTARLSRLAKLLDNFEKVDTWLYRLAALDYKGRPGALKATGGEHGQFTALIQPNHL